MNKKIDMSEHLNFVETSTPDVVAKYIDQLKQQLAELQEKYDACQEARKLEIEFKNQEFDEHVQELIDMEKQLAEKDTFIKELQNDNRELRKGLNKSGLDYFISSLNSIRHQICDEIRERIENDFEYDCEYTYGRLIEIIDQVEKGDVL